MKEYVHFTEQAKQKAIELSHIAEHQHKPLRLYIEGKGCDGFFYGAAFDRDLEGDLTQRISNDLVAVIDPDSLPFIGQSVIDWVDDERGQGFLFENPNQKHFRGKFFKRSAWIQHYQSKHQS